MPGIIPSRRWLIVWVSERVRSGQHSVCSTEVVCELSKKEGDAWMSEYARDGQNVDFNLGGILSKVRAYVSA